MISKGARLTAAATAAGLLTIGAAMAAQPVPMGIDLQPSNSPIMTEIRWFHNALLLPIITVITLFVLGLLIYVMARFNSKTNPVPSKTTHHVGLEVAWTVIPIIILIVIAIPSFQLLYKEQTIPRADITVKATGNSWYWSYTYPDHGGFEFNSNMIPDSERRDPVNQPRLLAVDNEMVVPVGAVVRVQVTANGVLHAFAVPAFGVKIDAVPGRLNETWFRAERTGVYYGQCSELCGRLHAFMPIAVRVVEPQAFASWVDDARRRFAATPPANAVADATPAALSATR
jgi:cytochrome c oxidase subunit 2